MIFVIIREIFEKENKINQIKSLIIEEEEEENIGIEMENFDKKENDGTNSEDEITEITVSSSSS